MIGEIRLDEKEYDSISLEFKFDLKDFELREINEFALSLEKCLSVSGVKVVTAVSEVNEYVGKKGIFDRKVCFLLDRS